jgi:hypothetical protein
MLVRVIDYTIDDGRDNDTSYRLFTTLLDPDEAPNTVSFTAALRITRTSIAQQGAFPPDDHTAHQHHWQHVLTRRLTRLNPHPASPGRPRVINARCPDGTSNAPTTQPGPTPVTPRPIPSSRLTERYWGYP